MLEQHLYKQISNLKSATPLVEAITNYVTINDSANILLSIGASPAMCESADEAYDFTKLSSAVYLNIGTLTKEQELAMLQAVKAADELSIPVVLDPVGCAAIPRRIGFIDKLRSFGKIDVIKGNLGEIKSLAGVEAKVRGVDSIDEGDDGVEVCQQLAREWNCIIIATGKQDVVTDGTTTALIQNGSEMLTRITGAGCMLGALTSGFCGANPKELMAACIASVLSMGVAGELAANIDRGTMPGSFKVFLMDEIYRLTDETLKEKAKIELV
ncbi:hydroxyethylthiazole kinase [Psychroflexus tropicus]|uniref:hydroxyethylthiazole kinase n=1 Tax=Psychroflexus tropicus TaxID=197345 RepID=UPI00037D4C56|nr:hydroxyethylthiazole kinase [Psychroflexus tropicus]